jgi:hypothetical protein
MADNEDQLIDLATVAVSILAIAVFVVTLVYFGTSAALAEEARRGGHYWHQVCQSQNSADVLRCRAYLQGLRDGSTVGRRRRTSHRRSRPITDCSQAPQGRHELRQPGNGMGSHVDPTGVWDWGRSDPTLSATASTYTSGLPSTSVTR